MAFKCSSTQGLFLSEQKNHKTAAFGRHFLVQFWECWEIICCFAWEVAFFKIWLQRLRRSSCFVCLHPRQLSACFEIWTHFVPHKLVSPRDLQAKFMLEMQPCPCKWLFLLCAWSIRTNACFSSPSLRFTLQLEFSKITFTDFFASQKRRQFTTAMFGAWVSKLLGIARKEAHWSFSSHLQRKRKRS